VGMIVRAATERPALTRALGVEVDRWITPVFGFGVALAALGGVLAAPVYQVSPVMGADIIIVIFAVVVIGGLGSILGAVVAGLLVGLISALSQIFGYPQFENALVFVVMAVVLLVRPAGLFGSAEAA
jgi:branched-chain amino acid transport system permease protein